MRMTRHLKHFMQSCNTGVALIEFAFVLPLLLIMLIGMIELTNYTIINQKLDKVATSMANFVTQGTTVGVSELNFYAEVVPQIMSPYTFSGTVVFSSVANGIPPNCPPNAICSPPPPCSCISWQHSILGADPSQIGSPGGVATLPSGYTVLSGQNIIVAEAYQHYAPLLSISGNFVPAFTPQTLYKIAIFKPRQGSLNTLGP